MMVVHRFSYLIVLVLIGVALTSCSKEQHPEMQSIQTEIEQLIEGFEGEVGVYVKHLPSGREIAIRADSIFPTASMIKVPIAARIFELMDLGELHYDSTHVYEDRLYYPGSDVVGAMKDGERISLHKLLFLSLSFSDNTASLWLQELAGTGTQVNDLMERLGLTHTRVNSRTDGRQDNFRAYGWGQTTPREMARLVEMIYRGEVVNDKSSEELYRLMSKTLWDRESLSVIPKHINVASKQGSVSASRSEVYLVNAHRGDYVVCVITKNQLDRSWRHDNQGYVLLRDISEILWNHLGDS